MREALFSKIATIVQPNNRQEYKDILFPIRERLFHNTVLAFVIILSGAFVVTFAVEIAQGNNPLFTVNPGAFLSVAAFWTLFLAQRILPYHLRTLLFVAIIYMAALLALLNTGMLGPFRYNLLALVIIGTIFGGFQRGLLLALVATATALLGGFMVHKGLITPDPAFTEVLLTGEAWLREAIRFSAVTTTLMVVSFQLIRESQRTFQRQQALTKQLEEERLTLDSRIAERTRALRLTAEVSRTLVMILDKDQLVLEVVEQIQKTFNYYHVHIYLLDEEQAQLLMAGGTGEAGKALLIGKHKIAVGQGLVGRAALMGVPILVSDVSHDKYWLPNPLLPETRSEIAIPIIHENKVIGVLDVQEDNANNLSEADVDLLETIGNQMGIALTNADLYARRTTQALRQARLNEISNKIQFASDLETTVQVAVREVGETLQVNRTSIVLNPPSVTNGKKTDVKQLEEQI